MKTNLVKNMESFQTIRRDGEHFKPALMLSGTRQEKVFTDCRFTISFDGMPADFYAFRRKST